MDRRNRKDVVILCQYFYPEKITSALLPYMTAEKLVDNSFSVDVICGIPSNYLNNKVSVPKNEEVRGINVKRLSYLTFKSKKFFYRIMNFLSLILSFFFQIPSLRFYKAIIVYSNPPILPIIAILAKKLFGNKLIFVCYDVYPEIAINSKIIKKDSIISRFMNIVNKKLFKNADRVVALSQEMKEFIINNRDISLNKVIVIPNWSTEVTCSLPQNMETEVFTISYFGNIGIAQDFEAIKIAMRHFSNDPTIRWIFAGHGKYYEALNRFVDENKIDNVRLVGYLNQKELNDLAMVSSCFILSLKNDLTGLAVPSKFYTYLNYRRPIIAVISKNTDIYKEINLYNIGIGVENDNPVKLINSINNIKENPGKYSNEIYDKIYNPDLSLAKYVEMMKEMI